MSGGVEEVGARLVLLNGPQFRAGLASAVTSLRAFNTEQERTARLAGMAAKAQESAAATTVTSARTAATAATASVDAQVSAQQRAVIGYKGAQAEMVKAQAVYDAKLAAATKRTMTAAVAGSTKLLKLTAGVGAVVGYESIKNFMSLQQMISQSGIDAGVKASQLPVFTKMALQVSSATGLAAAGTNGIADAMYRLASAYPGLHMTSKEMGNVVKQAADLSVMAGQTGNLDQISRTYGAIISTGVPLTRGSSALNYSQANKINQWMLAVTGHGDVKMGDLVGALGTGILASAKTTGVSLNALGAAADVLFPAMPALQASTRLSHALSMIAQPSNPAVKIMGLAGLNPLSIAGAIKSGDLGGGMAMINKFLTTPLSSPGAYKALASMHFTPSQITQGISGGFSAMSPLPGQPATGGTAMALSRMYGGARFGSTIQQLLASWKSGEYQNKLKLVGGQETDSAYQASLKLAYSEPIVQWHKFQQWIKNESIDFGSTITPKFTAFLGELHKIGDWFGAHKWAMHDLARAGEGILAGAAVLKLAAITGRIVGGGASIARVIMNPSTALRGLFSGKATGLDGAALRLDGAAAALTRAAEKLAIAGGGGVLGGAEAAAARGGAAGWLARKLGGTKIGRALGIGKDFRWIGGLTGKAVLGGIGIGATVGTGLDTLINHYWKPTAGGGPLKSVPGAGAAHTAGLRVLNWADTAANIFTGGLFHPHLDRNTLDYHAPSQTQQLATWAKTIQANPQRWAGLTPEGRKAAESLIMAGDHTITAAQEQKASAKALKEAADSISAMGAAWVASQLPATQHVLAKTGLQSAAARK